MHQKTSDTAEGKAGIIKNVFEGYRRFNSSPLDLPPECLEFQSFFKFCSDFEVIPPDLSKIEIRNILVVIEKLNFQVNSANITYMKLDQFIEALFVASYSQVLMPSKLQLDDPSVGELYTRLQQADTRRIYKAARHSGTNTSQPQLKARTSRQLDKMPPIGKGDALGSETSRHTDRGKKSRKMSEELEISAKPEMSASIISHTSRVVKDDEGYWEKGIRHFEELIENLKIPNRRWDAFKMIEERRKRLIKSQPRYWEGI